MNNMTEFDPATLEKQARDLRRKELSRLSELAFNRLSEALRRQHEAWLRRKSQRPVAAAIGTPV